MKLSVAVTSLLPTLLLLILVSGCQAKDTDFTRAINFTKPNTPIVDVERNATRDLIVTKHQNVLPYTSDEPDVWDVLIDVDGYDEAASGTRIIKRIFAGPEVVTPAYPHDQGTCQYWNRERL